MSTFEDKIKADINIFNEARPVEIKVQDNKVVI